MKNCSFINKPIVIFRGDDTSAFNLRTIKIILKGDLDLSNAIAKFTLLDYRKEWTVPEVASGELTMSFTSADTKAMPLGEQTGTFRLYDMSTGEPRQLTVVNKIPFLVTNRVCELDEESYHADVSVASGEIISIEFNVGVGAVNGKADKVKNATSGDLAGLDSEGNLTDSDIPASDVLRKSQMDATPTAGSQNPVTSDGVKQAIDDATPSDYEQVKSQVEQNTTDIGAIEGKIPSQASAQNQLADKDFVNSSIATNTATFRGTYNLVSDLGLTTSATHEQVAAAVATKLAALSITPENNDYCFVQVPKSDAEPTVIVRVDRYKCTVEDGVSSWDYEWSLNNSSFTTDQWAAINSGITSALVAKLGALPTADELAAALLAKYEKPATGIPKTDLSSGVQDSLDKADTALQTAPVTSVNNKTGAVTLTGADLPVSSSDATKVDVALGNKLDNSGASEKFIDFGNGNKIGFSYFGTKLSISLYYLNARMASFICDEGTVALENAFGNWAALPTANGVLALVSQIYAAVQQIAPDFTAKVYVTNELCSYNGVVYRCKDTYTAASSSPKPNSDTTHWEAKKVSELFLPLTGGEVHDITVHTPGEYHGSIELYTDGVDGPYIALKDNANQYILSLYSDRIITHGRAIMYPVAPGALALLQNLAGDFLTSATYAINDLCVYNNRLYRCTTAHQGAWDNSHFAIATVQDVLAAIWTALDSKAPLASPAFTGTPTAPTPTAGDDSTKVATTAFVQNAIGGITPGPDNNKLNSTSAAPAFSSSATYAVGDYVTYQGDLYVCSTAVSTAGDWTGSTNWTAANMTSPDATFDVTSQNALRLVDANGNRLWMQGYNLETPTVTSGAATLSNEAVNYIELASTASADATVTLSLPARTTGKVSDFVLDVANKNASYTLTLALDSSALDTTFGVVVPDGNDLTTMFTIAAGEMAEFYFTLTQFTKTPSGGSGTIPMYKIVKQVVVDATEASA